MARERDAARFVRGALGCVAAHGRLAKRQGLLLTCHVDNRTARSFYAANSLVVSPISPARCLPPPLADGATYELLQSLWEAEAERTMEARGALARAALQGSAGEHETPRGEGAAAANAVAAAASPPPLCTPSAVALRSPPPVAPAESARSIESGVRLADLCVPPRRAALAASAATRAMETKKRSRSGGVRAA